MQSSYPSIEYKLAIHSISQHLFSVEMHIPSLGREKIKVSLPSWIPGSYMIRDFAKNVVTIDAINSAKAPVGITALDKQTWLVDTQNQAITISYRI